MSVSLNFTVPFPWGQSKVFPVLSRVENFAAAFFFFFFFLPHRIYVCADSAALAAPR